MGICGKVWIDREEYERLTEGRCTWFVDIRHRFDVSIARYRAAKRVGNKIAMIEAAIDLFAALRSIKRYQRLFQEIRFCLIRSYDLLVETYSDDIMDAYELLHLDKES